jgi:Protein of unknown function (DUF3987)
MTTHGAADASNGGYSPLEPDRDQLEIFVNALFRYAPKQGFVSIRAFYEGESSKAFRISPTSLAGGLKFLIEVAEDDARRAANAPQPVVFCAPIAIFANDKRAREEDLALGLAITVECDMHAQEARARLEQMLGPSTVVVRSGGEWRDAATGEGGDKLHVHYRLKQPAKGKEQLEKLKYARELATKLVGGDPSNAPICHPLRWPGSWHRKSKPRLCEIESVLPDNEIDLAEALTKLNGGVAPPGGGPQQATGGTKQQQQDGQGALDWDHAFGEIITGAGFHPALTPLASSFAARGIPEAAARGVLRALLTNTQTTDHERLRRRDTELAKLKDTVRSGYEKFAAAAAAPTGAVLFDPWQEFVVPIFPFDILPGVAHDFVERKSIAMGADPSALAMATLAAFSGAIHHRFRVKMMRNNDWWEHLRLWVLLFGRSSWLKSPILEAVMRPIKRYQVELQRDYRTRKREYEEQKKAGNDDAEEPEPPERFTVGDATIEKLGEILSWSERGLLAEHDELAGWIGRMERYHVAGKGASADRAFYLQSWNGGGYTIDRVKSGEIFVPNLSLSMVGGIQPARMAELRGLTSDGLLQRFAIVLMRAPRLAQDIDCTDVVKAYTALVYELISLRPQRFYLTDDAAEAMAELLRHLHSLEQVGEAVTEAFEAHIGKLKSYAGVLSIILHLAINPKETIRHHIGRQTVGKVHRLMSDFLLPHAHEFYSLSEGESERLRKLASYVLTCGKDRLRLAEFTTNVWDLRGKSVLEVNQRVSPLVAGGWLAPIEQGPACRAWDVNRAAIDAQFAARAQTERDSKAALAQLMGR